jgi:hypothetical protein
MLDEPKNAIDQFTSDPSFLMMLAGAAIWFMGYYLWVLEPLFVTTGFALVCFACATNALKRPVGTAWPGMLLGGLVMIIGNYLLYVPWWGYVLGRLLYVAGAVMVIFFALPLALQRGELPVLTELQKFWDKQSAERKKPKKAETEKSGTTKKPTTAGKKNKEAPSSEEEED